MRKKSLVTDLNEVQKLIIEETKIIRDLLLKKNKAYGNSAIIPIRMFSKVNPLEQINVRIDDKLSRIGYGIDKEEIIEDTEQDLIGYLILKRVVKKFYKRKKNNKIKD